MVHGDDEELRGGTAPAARRRGGDGGRGIDESEWERNRRRTLASTDRCDGELDELFSFIVDSADELAGRARTAGGCGGSTSTLNNQTSIKYCMDQRRPRHNSQTASHLPPTDNICLAIKGGSGPKILRGVLPHQPLHSRVFSVLRNRKNTYFI